MITLPAPDSEPTNGAELHRLAELAFASREPADLDPQAHRHLAFLPPDALDMDLLDPLQRDFGDYELREKIGQGGMGVVYRAHQRSLDRDVALKLLAAGPWASREFIHRFKREAQSAARLEHPNIVTVFETGDQHDLHYFSMRLVRGESLAARLQREGAQPPRVAAHLLRVVADALDYAHRLGVLHLDLKPGNVLIDEAGEPMVADFGLARRIDEALADRGEDVSGTPSYMAPEQAVARSLQIGCATDIYGLGCILYELLCGRPPFLAASAQATLKRVVNDQVQPLRELDAKIPLDLEAVCLKCLAKDPQQRYPSAAALADEMRRFLEDRPVSVRRPGVLERCRRWVRREPRVAISACAVVLALLGGLAVSAQQWRRAELSAAASRSLLWSGRQEAALRLEQDGRGFEALPRLLDNLAEQQAAGEGRLAALQQQRIGLLGAQGVSLIDRIAINDANPLAVELSPGGGRLAIAFNDQTVRWYDSDSLEERGRVSLAHRPSSSGDDRPPLLLRFVDDRRLRVTLHWIANLTHPTDGDTWLIDLEQARVLEPPDGFADFADATYGADGRFAVLRDHRQNAQLWQAGPWRALSGPVHVGPDFTPWVLDPGARFALSFGLRQRELQFRAWPGLRVDYTLRLPGNSGVSAWALSRDGGNLALGDFEGRIFLFDTRNRELRTLPSSRGGEVTWLAFSEDDAWISGASADGRVLAFDVQSGDALVSAPLLHDFPVRRVDVNHARRLLVASGEGRVALWWMPPPGKSAVSARRIGLGPAPHALAGPFASGWSMHAGLLATAGIDGQVRLWRLPLPPGREAIAARQVPERTGFDGRQLVDVNWNQIRIASADGDRATEWQQLQQPPGFAELLDQGRMLGLTQGAELRLLRLPGWRQQGAAIALQGTPQRWLATADGSRLLLVFGAAGRAGFEEHLSLIDLRRPQRTEAGVALRGPLRQLQFSADGERLLAVGPEDAATWMLDGRNLATLGEFQHDPFQPVQRAAFDRDNGTVLLVTLAPDPRIGSDLLLQWQPGREDAVRERSTLHARPLGVQSIEAGIFVGGRQQDLLFGDDERPRIVPRHASSAATALLEISPDRRLLARGFRREVQLHDLGSGDPLGAPLQADINDSDMIVQLAFSPDASRLLGRTVQGKWLMWGIAADRRDAGQMVRQLDPIRTEQESQRVLFVPTLDERASLRARDPGAWPVLSSRPVVAGAPQSTPGISVPRRTPGASPLQVDLSAVYDAGPETQRGTNYTVMPQLRPAPAGLQRLGGVDFDMRGTLTIGHGPRGGLAEAGDAPPRVECLPLPPATAAGLYLLLRSNAPLPVPTGEALMHLRLHYSDGGSVESVLRAGIDLPGYAGADEAVPGVFVTGSILVLLGLHPAQLNRPYVVNPHPDRLLRCMDLEVNGGSRPVMLLAVTLAPERASSDAVIPAAQSPSTSRVPVETRSSGAPAPLPSRLP